MECGCCMPRSAKRDSNVNEERPDGGRGSAHLAEATLVPGKKSILTILDEVLVPPPSSIPEEYFKPVLNGASYGQSMLYHAGADSQAISPVTYIWRPLVQSSTHPGTENGASDVHDFLWSIIFPVNWIKAFWISMVSHGVHEIGLQERRWIACEATVMHVDIMEFWAGSNRIALLIAVGLPEKLFVAA
ncbi:hypothetical protein EJ110_NYTH14685 [Nymphaea thermarum]|nr:hypothetical protein EJ110_NYTH14685 [Nymphaea thermarum]